MVREFWPSSKIASMRVILRGGHHCTSPPLRITGSIEMVTTLLELGTACNIAHNGGRTPLWATAISGTPPLLQLVGGERGRHDTQRLYHGTKAKPEEVKLLIDLGCSVGEEVDAASREAAVTDSFAKAISANAAYLAKHRRLLFYRIG